MWPATFRKLYTDLYIALVNRHPQLWRMLYHATSKADPASPTQKLRRAIERLSTRALRCAIDAFAPDAIVCTHFLPAEILMHEIHRERLAVPVWVQVTDFDLHGMWVIPRMTGYFAASEEVAFRMRAAGIPAERIQPVYPGDARLRRAVGSKSVRTGFGLDPALRTILLMGGGGGLGGLDEVAASLLRLGQGGTTQDFQLIVLAGRNLEALTRLRTLAAGQSRSSVPVWLHR